MVGGLFSRSNPEQKSGLLSRLISALGPGASSLLAGKGLSGLVGSSGEVNPQAAARHARHGHGTCGPRAKTKSVNRRFDQWFLRAASNPGKNSRGGSASDCDVQDVPTCGIVLSACCCGEASLESRQVICTMRYGTRLVARPRCAVVGRAGDGTSTAPTIPNRMSRITPSPDLLTILSQ
jgi:hypothetical protein